VQTDQGETSSNFRSQVPLIHTYSSEREFVWRNWRNAHILYSIQCEVPLH